MPVLSIALNRTIVVVIVTVLIATVYVAIVVIVINVVATAIMVIVLMSFLFKSTDLVVKIVGVFRLIS